jgi:hypothetical protein
MDEGIEKFAPSGKGFSLKTAFLFLNKLLTKIFRKLHISHCFRKLNSVNNLTLLSKCTARLEY